MTRKPAALFLALATVPAVASEPSRGVEFLNPPEAAAAEFPFSQAVRAGDTLYLSGQIGIDPKSGKLVEGGIAAESKQTMQNIRAALERHGHSMRDLVKCTAMLADIAEWGQFNDVYRTFFDGRFPARSALGANGLVLGARIEVECIAHVGK